MTNIANYGLKDGKVFDFISRTTPTGGKDQNFIGQIIGGASKLAPGLPGGGGGGASARQLILLFFLPLFSISPRRSSNISGDRRPAGAILRVFVFKLCAFIHPQPAGSGRSILPNK